MHFPVPCGLVVMPLGVVPVPHTLRILRHTAGRRKSTSGIFVTLINAVNLAGRRFCRLAKVVESLATRPRRPVKSSFSMVFRVALKRCLAWLPERVLPKTLQSKNEIGAIQNPAGPIQ